MVHPDFLQSHAPLLFPNQSAYCILYTRIAKRFGRWGECVFSNPLHVPPFIIMKSLQELLKEKKVTWYVDSNGEQFIIGTPMIPCNQKND